MLQDLGTGDGPFLVDMADDEDGDPPALGQFHQRQGAALHLGDAAGSGVQGVIAEGLDRVHDEDLRLLGVHRLQQVREPGLGEDIEILALRAEPLAAELQLILRLLPGYIEDLSTLAELTADLQHQGGFADARRSAHQDEGALHDAASQHPIQLPDAAGEPDLALLPEGGDGTCLPGQIKADAAALPLPCRCPLWLLHNGVPGAAGGTLPRPATELVAAVCAVKGSLVGFHGTPSPAACSRPAAMAAASVLWYSAVFSLSVSWGLERKPHSISTAGAVTFLVR